MTAGIFLVLIAAVSIEWLFLIFTKIAKWKFIQKWFTKIPSLRADVEMMLERRA